MHGISTTCTRRSLFSIEGHFLCENLEKCFLYHSLPTVANYPVFNQIILPNFLYNYLLQQIQEFKHLSFSLGNSDFER